MGNSYMYLYLKALHIIFVVTWFAGLFYMPRLFIYNTEASTKSPEIAKAFHEQFSVMMKRLWFGITWPSAILTLILGGSVWYMLGVTPGWLITKLFFVIGLFAYHLSIHFIFTQQLKGIFKYTSQQLRIWNEVATVFLLAIVMLVVVKQNISAFWGVIGLLIFIFILMSAIKIYKTIRDKKSD